MTDAQPESQGKRLRQEREKHHWTQEQLAKKSGVSVSSIRRWENGRVSSRKAEQALLTKAFGKPPEQWGNAGQLWNVPFPRNRYFTGRERLLERLHDALAVEQTVALSQAISGLGGIGKTATAIEYVYRYAHEYEAVLWVRADSKTLVSDFAALAAVLDLPERHEHDQLRVAEAVKRWLREHGSWLLIFDNADDLARVFEFMPGRDRGTVLLTTRAQATGSYIENIEMGKMSREDGIDFLLRRKHADNAQRLSFADPQEREEAGRLWECLEGLPLALDQAAAYIEETRCTFSDYLDVFRTHSTLLLRRRGETAGDHLESVAATWEMALKKVEQANLAAAELLRFCAFLHADAIPEAMIIKGAGALGPALQSIAMDKPGWNEAIGALLKYSLVKRDDKKILTIHRLVQAVIKDDMKPKTIREWAKRTVLAVNAAFPKPEPDSWPQCESLLPHSLLAAQYIEAYQILSEEAGRLLYETAVYLHDRARFAEAELLYQQALHIRERQLGLDHPDVATSLNGLALLYKEKGKYDEAEPLFQRALSIREQQLGSEHSLVAYPLNNLAEVYREQGKYVEAKSLYQRALHILEQQKSEQRALAGVLNNLAILYLEQSEYDEAETLHQRALRIREQQLGSEHPDTATSFNNLAVLYLLQGKYTEAEPLYQRALGIWKQLFGSEHPLVASTLNGLAILYTEQGKYAEAEPLFQRALRIREQQLGSEHPDTAELLHYYGVFEEKRGNPQAAYSLYQRALTLFEKAFGPQHPKTRDTRQRLAALLRALERHEEAVQLEAIQSEP